DRCGAPVDCGGCGTGETCGAYHVCSPCVANGDPCAGLTCGSATDSCGVQKSRGRCRSGQLCGSPRHRTTNRPAISARPARPGAAAGRGRAGWGGPDRARRGRGPGQPCDPTPHACRCAPKMCAASDCGSVADGCGGTLACGNCQAAGQVCDAPSHTCMT